MKYCLFIYHSFQEVYEQVYNSLITLFSLTQDVCVHTQTHTHTHKSRCLKQKKNEL